MWFYDPYEVEWRLTRARGIAIRRGGVTSPTARPRPLIGRARRLVLATRVLVDETLAREVTAALADCCRERSRA